MEHEQCGAGITNRALRFAFRDELLVNRDLIDFLAEVAGVEEIVEVGEIAFRYKTGVTISCVDARGSAIDISLDIHTDKLLGPLEFLTTREMPTGRPITHGARRIVTVAPEEWFTVKANAEASSRPVVLEHLKGRGSASFQSAVDQACARADWAFQELRRPKLELPGWVKRRLWA